MKKKAAHDEGHDSDESWLLPYTDMVTLLLALFIILYAMSTVDEAKFERLRYALETMFAGSQGILVSDSGLAESDIKPLQDNPPTPNFVTEDRILQEYSKQLNEYFASQGLEGVIASTMTRAGLLISIQDLALFDSGRAALRTEAFDLLRFLAFLLEELPNDVQVAGHTDNLPISTAEFPSNWELSTQRALNVMRFLLQDNNLSSQRFSVVGFGEYQPIDTNSTVEGRANNRRVELIILRQYPLPVNESGEYTVLDY